LVGFAYKGEEVMEFYLEMPTNQNLTVHLSVRAQMDAAYCNCPLHLHFIGCLLSDSIPLPRRGVICRPVFEQINTYYTALSILQNAYWVKHKRKIKWIY